MADLDRMRIPEKQLPLLTAEQFEIIHYARSGNPPISWTKLHKWYVEHFGHVNCSTLKTRYNSYLEYRNMNNSEL